MKTRSSHISVLVLTILAPAIWGCAGEGTRGEDESGAAAGFADRARGSRGVAGARSARGRSETGVPSASTQNVVSPPTDPCGWITVAEIEGVIGKLDGPPKPDGIGCWYHVPIDSSTAEWTRMREIQARLREMPGYQEDAFRDMALDRPGLFLGVDLTGGILEDRAVAAAVDHMAGWMAGDSPMSEDAERDEAPVPPAGWDDVGSPLGRAGFTGRVGHVKVLVELQNLRLPAEAVEALAVRVRDRLPDLPFAHPYAGVPGSPPSGPDPCSVLTRTEAEGVLGRLTVPPYRSRDGSALADPAGASCAYLTPGHHALVVTPEWSYGRTALEATRGVGDLIGSLVNMPGVVADTLEGPWDDAATDAATGDLLFLKGDRLLQIGFATSSTDAAGAVRLARVALDRM